MSFVQVDDFAALFLHAVEGYDPVLFTTEIVNGMLKITGNHGGNATNLYKRVFKRRLQLSMHNGTNDTPSFSDDEDVSEGDGVSSAHGPVVAEEFHPYKYLCLVCNMTLNTSVPLLTCRGCSYPCHVDCAKESNGCFQEKGPSPLNSDTGLPWLCSKCSIQRIQPLSQRDHSFRDVRWDEVVNLHAELMTFPAGEDLVGEDLIAHMKNARSDKLIQILKRACPSSTSEVPYPASILQSVTSNISVAPPYTPIRSKVTTSGLDVEVPPSPTSILDMLHTPIRPIPARLQPLSFGTTNDFNN